MTNAVVSTQNTIHFDNGLITIDDVINIAENLVNTSLSEDTDYQAFIQRGADYVMQILADGKPVYGINTGLGDSCDVLIPDDLALALSKHLVTYHGCGLGQHFTSKQARAIMAEIGRAHV